MSHRAEPVGGPILTRPFKILLALLVFGLLLTAWRFVSGLGPTTGMNDGYAWGIWIAYDVVTGTALACGGYAVALLCYVLNQGKYHPMVRPAVLTSALGYTLAGVSIVIDVGRYWNLRKVPLLFRVDITSDESVEMGKWTRRSFRNANQWFTLRYSDSTIFHFLFQLAFVTFDP